MRQYLLKTLTVFSLLICIASGWCWKRSYSTIDIISHDRFVDRGCALSGFGSYRGALVIGSLDLPRFYMPRFTIVRRM